MTQNPSIFTDPKLVVPKPAAHKYLLCLSTNEMSQTSLPIRLASTSKDGNSATPQCLLKQTSPTSNASNLNSKITTTVDQTPISHSAAMVKQSLVMANASVTKPIILECEASHTLRRPSSSGLVSVPKTTKIDIRVSDVLTLASLRKSISLENTRPFRFSDLPPELREKAFKILLCNFKNIPKLSKDRQLAELHMKLFYLAHHNDYTILRANRAIYNEAQYAMRKSNLFVKVILNVRFGSERSPIETALISFRLPVMWLCVCHASDFSHSVLTHEISYAVNQEPAKPTIFVFLGRDMNRFVGALENFSSQLYEEGIRLVHRVTLVDPYARDVAQVAEPFYSEKLQEAVIKPYRMLKGFSDFTIDNILEPIRAAALADITRVPDDTPEQVIAHLEAMKERANTVYKSGNSKGAGEMYAEAIVEMINMTRGQRADPVFNAPTGGPDFANCLANLHFILCSNRIQCYLNQIRERIADGLNRDSFKFMQDIISTSEEAGTTSLLYRKCTWEPSEQQVSKILYKEGVACKLMGSSCSLERGMVVIEEAIRRCPGDPVLKRERNKIQACIARLNGSHFLPEHPGDRTMIS